MSLSQAGETETIDARAGAILEASGTQLRQAIRAIYDLKEKRAQLAEQDRKWKKLQDQLETTVGVLLKNAGLDTIAIDEDDIEKRLTASLSNREFYSLSDKERFMQFVFELQDPDMISNVRPAVEAMKVYRDTQHKLPPGVTVTSAVELSLRATRKLKRDIHE